MRHHHEARRARLQNVGVLRQQPGVTNLHGVWVLLVTLESVGRVAALFQPHEIEDASGCHWIRYAIIYLFAYLERLLYTKAASIKE